jgi:hypothetical protein
LSMNLHFATVSWKRTWFNLLSGYSFVWGIMRRKNLIANLAQDCITSKSLQCKLTLGKCRWARLQWLQMRSCGY